MNYYDLLGIDPQSSFETLKKAYYKKAKTCHPDLFGNSPEKTQEFQLLVEAFNVLSNAEKRRCYDESLQVKNSVVEQGRATYVVERALSRGKPVVLISNFACSFDLPHDPWHERQNAYICASERIAKALACDHLYYIRGRDIVTELSLLAADMIHPSTYGHTEMGRRIAQKMREDLHII
ncbi:MAG: DnaJ domain-containing protein [Clostridia bacterium]|nr:DnaJ domain-containing protein [Clostridia bacterium]